MPDISALGNRCCGCGACEAICPRGAIRLEPDACGFRLAVLDSLGCIKCGACDKVCPVLCKQPSDGIFGAWWATALDERMLERSSSGGLFGMLARRTLEKGGVVYGAAFSEDLLEVLHIRIDGLAELDAVMRSKYVQSRIEEHIYREIREDLIAGRFVLFAGTACQIAAVNGYLGKHAGDRNLLRMDVICHGVPSPRLWSEWVAYKKMQAAAEIDRINFRSKVTGWSSYSVAYEYRNKNNGVTFCESIHHCDDWYMAAFLANASLRSSCFACPVKRSCGSDITLGDYWGIQSFHPKVDCERGVSAVIANTRAGLEAIEDIRDEIAWGDTEYEAILKGNPSLCESATPHAKRSEFIQDISSDFKIADLVRKWDFSRPFLSRMRSRFGNAKRRVLNLFSALS